MKNIITMTLAITMLATSFVYAHEKVKLTGYITDKSCASKHVNDKPADATKFAANHPKDCALKESCAKSGYGIFAVGKWYPFDSKGNELAKAFLAKTTSTKGLKSTVTGKKHEGKILVESIK